MYNERVIEEFSHPKNVGEMKDANAVGTVGNAVCGDIMKIFMKNRRKRRHPRRVVPDVRLHGRHRHVVGGHRDDQGQDGGRGS